MANEFRLPDIGEGLAEAEVVRWVVPIGGEVGIDETVVELETDKAVVEIPSPYAGFVLHHGAAEGEVIEVGAILVVVGEQGEAWPGDTAGESGDTTDQDTSADPSEDRDAEESAVEDQAEDSPEDVGLGSVASGLADSKTESDSDVAPIVGTLSEDAEELPSRSQQITQTINAVKALPLVRKLARERGVDLNSVHGSGPDGRVTREDVLAVLEAGGEADFAPPPAPTLPPVPSMPAPAQTTVAAGERPEPERRPMSKLRRTIAANMTASWSQIPHVTTFDEVDASRLLAMRSALAKRHDTKIPLEALIIKAVTPVLSAFPEFNSSLDGDDLVVHAVQDVGIAVDTPDGLLVAVIRNANRRSVLSLSQEVRRLGDAAKNRKLATGELSGQTFTVSNIGAVGGGFGTPIVPSGTVAILSVGRAVDKPAARDGRIEIAPLLPLSLSYDHRVIDGGLGRRFMATLLENLEEPGLFLAD